MGTTISDQQVKVSTSNLLELNFLLPQAIKTQSHLWLNWAHEVLTSDIHETVPSEGQTHGH